MPENGPAELLRRRVAAEPARPLVTFYDDATGERVELSARTFDNWVAKTANLLVDGLAAEPGDRVVLALPPHWQTAAWLFAIWSAGLVAEPMPPDESPELSESPEPRAGAAPYFLATAEEVLPQMLETAVARDAQEIVGLSLHALGAPLRERPPDVVDYAAEVRSYGDRFAPIVPVDPDAPALVVMKNTFTGADVNREAVSAASRWGLDVRSRVLADVSYFTLEGLISGLLAPIASGGSVIIQRNIDNSVTDRRISLEHVTAVAGVAGWNASSASVRRLL